MFGTRPARLGTRSSQRLLPSTSSFRSSSQHRTWKHTSQTSSSKSARCRRPHFSHSEPFSLSKSGTNGCSFCGLRRSKRFIGAASTDCTVRLIDDGDSDDFASWLGTPSRGHPSFTHNLPVKGPWRWGLHSGLGCSRSQNSKDG